MRYKILALFISILLILTVLPESGFSIPHANKNFNNKTDYCEIINPLSSEIEELSKERAMVKLIQQLNESMVNEYLENITAYGPRVTGTTGCEIVGKYIFNELEKMRLEVKYHSWKSNGLHGKNIEGTLNGTDSSSNSIYILCGHYDGVPETQGSDDNGAGVATILATAKVMSQYEFKNDIRFVFFSGEEQGLLGSYAYAKQAKNNKDNVKAVLNIDMTGFCDCTCDEPKVWIFKNFMSNWISKRTSKISKEYYELIGLGITSSIYFKHISDHNSFWHFRYNAVYFSEHEINPYFHSPGDNIKNMNISYTIKVAKLIIATLAELSSIAFKIDGKTLYVNKNNAENYNNIQDAINNATICDTVIVYNGTYKEHINVNKPINLIGEEKNITFISCDKENVVLISSSWVYFSGFTIKNFGNNWLNAGMALHTNKSIISNNIIFDNNGFGIGVYRSSYNTLSFNIIIDNKDGICLWYNSCDNIIQGNVIINNEVCGVALGSESDYNKITQNIIENNSFGIYFQRGYFESTGNPCFNIISENEINKNNNGIYFIITSKKNIILKNNITFNNEGIFLWDSCNSNTIKKNNFIGNKCHASFNNCFNNRWIRNYWDNRFIKLSPKIIVGKISIIPWRPSFKWINIDFLPARWPYKII